MHRVTWCIAIVVLYTTLLLFVKTKMPKKQLVESILTEAKQHGVDLGCDMYDLLRLSYRQLSNLYDEIAGA